VARDLQVRISDTLSAALEERVRTSGQSLTHIVSAALAEALDVEHHSIFQVSTSGAIVQGLYQGCVTVADLRRHGDLGLGTFEDLDGEMILIDGHCFQARADGSVTEASDESLTPFATVVAFVADSTTQLLDVSSLAVLNGQLDRLRVSDNMIVAFRITGTFDSLNLRAACKHASGTDLVSATADQGLFDLQDIPGTVLGFWTPHYAEAIGIAGYHLHFISDDRRHGGHVLGLTAKELSADLHQVDDVHLAIPETQAFLEADLSGDTSAALDVAERNVRGSAST
jgi:acetolactate decarboxylase